MLLENSTRKWAHHSSGKFTNPIKRTAFEFDEVDGVQSADILKIDARFVSLLKWLGENHINVRLSGENRPEGYAVYKIRETEFGGGAKLSANDGFLQFMIERLLASDAPSEDEKSEEEEEEELTGEALAEMDFEELEDVCDDKDLDTDPDDFDEEDIEKLRKAIAKELGIKLPAKKEAKGKGKKGKK